MGLKVIDMSECESRINVESCLAELHRELTARGVKAQALRDQHGRACLDVYDRRSRPRRVHVFTQFYWFLWGPDHDQRHSLFQVPETADRLAQTALTQGWPPPQPLPTSLTNHQP